MTDLSLIPEITDKKVRQRAVKRLRELNVTLPTLTELADPSRIPATQQAILAGVGADEPVAANLWRVHWFNDEARTGRVDVPGYLVLPEALTGVKAKIVVALGDRFPMIGAHKVLAAYGCLVPRLVSGRFDPTSDKAIWPSTGNYCRGGVAISRTLGCRGVAVLPAGMSKERFDWLERWVSDPSDIIRTPGTESNVKEIYDKCAEIARDEHNVIVNQFSEFSNYLIHYHCTGRALDRVFADLRRTEPGLRLSAFVSATGSAGTIGAGDYLKQVHGTKIVAVEAIECPTMLVNGYGEHNIQGIGDKHIPLIHNVMNTDLVVGVSDRSSDALNLLFNDRVGRDYLTRRHKLDPALVNGLDNFGLSSIANVLAAIKIAKHLDLGPSDAIVTIATDSAALYRSERATYVAREYSNRFDEVNSGEIFGQHLGGVADDHVNELTYVDRKRVFNLGYYTWVEQQGVSVEAFDRRKDAGFWKALQDSIPAWDKLIQDFNEDTGARHAG
ncbi:MAG: pyridoxal-5-phosphate-dependent protein subunit beta [Betaproteobacteria bacterium]|jgi:cysteine synthase A|nr:pyridoxal-5-phosphate-dependent protein subunit beta [Betaproteobacteria bacterium]